MSHREFVEIGKYRILGQIGEGAMGVVYRAQDLVLNRPVAIKVMTDAFARDTDLRARFLREAQSAGSLQHPNVVTVYDFGESNGHLYIAMELVEGTDLIKILEEKRPLTLVQKIDILIDLLNGLAYAHKRGIVHRDVKPANIRIDEDGRARVMDFGIAHLSSSNMTRTGVTMGTPAYMSPEQIIGGTITAASDIFSAGAVMYELFTGKQAFAGDTLQTVLYKIINEAPPPLTLDPVTVPAGQRDAIARSLIAIGERALAKDPHARFQSALEMVAALSEVRAHVLTRQGLAGPSSLTATVSVALASSETQAVKSRRRVIAAAVGAGVVVLVGGAGLWISKRASGSVAEPVATVAAITDSGPAGPLAQNATAASQAPSGVATTAQSGTASQSRVSPPVAPPKTSVADVPNTRELQPINTPSRGAPTRANDSGTPTQPALSQPKLDDSPKVTPLATQTPTQGASIPQPQVAAPTTPATPPSNPSAEIGTVVAAYANALDARDLNALRAVFPGLPAADAKRWSDFFSSVRSLEVALAVKQLNITGQTADGTVTGTFDATYRDGKTQRQSVSFAMTFRRDGSAWILTGVR